VSCNGPGKGLRKGADCSGPADADRRPTARARLDGETGDVKGPAQPRRLRPRGLREGDKITRLTRFEPRQFICDPFHRNSAVGDMNGGVRDPVAQPQLKTVGTRLPAHSARGRRRFGETHRRRRRARRLRRLRGRRILSEPGQEARNRIGA